MEVTPPLKHMFVRPADYFMSVCPYRVLINFQLKTSDFCKVWWPVYVNNVFERMLNVVVGYLRHYIDIGMEWLKTTTELSVSIVEMRTGDLNKYEANPVLNGGCWTLSDHRIWNSRRNNLSPHRDLNLRPFDNSCVSVATSWRKGGWVTALKYFVHQYMYWNKKLRPDHSLMRRLWFI
jgi:hypothetical protein